MTDHPLKKRCIDKKKALHDQLAMESHHDQGAAWLILFASGANNIIMSSMYTVGLFNLTFLEVFRQSKSITAWCPAIMSALLSLAGEY